MTSTDTRIEAVVAVIRREGRVLVVKRGPRTILPGYWSPPSGRIEPGEGQRQAVEREMAEELGLVVKPGAKIWECPTDDGDFTLHWWTVEAGAEALRPDPDEVADARWVTPEEFLALDPTFEGDRRFFTEVLPSLESRR